MLNAAQEGVATAFTQFMLDPKQSEFVISGYSGAGKTFLTAELIRRMDNIEQLAKSINAPLPYIAMFVTATTNKAAAVLSETVGCECSTIHSLLGLRVTNDYSTGKTKLIAGKNAKMITDAVIMIDESSYVSPVLHGFIKKYTFNCKIIYIGDKYQLLDVGTTTSPVFDTGKIKQADIIGSERFNPNSCIARLGAQMRTAVGTDEFTNMVLSSDAVEHITGTQFQALLQERVTNNAVFGHETKIMCWTNAAADKYCNYIRNLEGKSSVFTVGDHLIVNRTYTCPSGKGKGYQTESEVFLSNIVGAGEEYGIEGNYVNFNGGGGIPVFIANDYREVRALLKATAAAQDWRSHFSAKETFIELRPVYASTVFKAQGSTFDEVFIDLSDIGRCNQSNIVARMLYVAITRARTKVYLYGKLPEKYGGTPTCL